MAQSHERKKKPDKYLFYFVDDGIYASRLADIKEVVTDLILEQIPIRNYSAVGMSSLRGEIISVLSLGKLLTASFKPTKANIESPLDEKATQNPKQTITLVVEHKNLKYGLVVDSIKQVDVLEPERLNESSDCNWINGHYKVDTRIATVLSLKSLLNTECP